MGTEKDKNRNFPYATLGASSHALHDRQTEDYYATDPRAARLLMDVEQFAPTIWECACGEGHLSREFERAGYNVISTDLIDRGYGEVLDFLATTELPCVDGGVSIITNPPYSIAQEFATHALELLPDGGKMALFLKIQFLEGQKRRALFDAAPPRTIYVSSSRIGCAMNGDFRQFGKFSAVCYAWYVWEKGYKGFPVIKWIN